MADPRIITVTLNPAVDRVIEAPHFAVGARVTGRVVAWYPTGRGITVSRALAAVGIRSIATGFVGRNELRMFEERLERVGEGRCVCQLLVVRARTRDNVTIVDPVNDSETHLRDEGFEVQPDDVARISSKLAMLSRPGAIVVFGGSLPRGVEPQQFDRMIGRCADAGARVVADTSGEALRALRRRAMWLLRISVSQLREFADRPVDTEQQIIDVARSLTTGAGGAIEHILVTRGADGAVLVGSDSALTGRTSVHPGRVVSTSGSAESLVGGLVGAWTRTGDWVEALKEGLALATANAVGREAGHLELQDIEEFRLMSVVEAAQASVSEA